MTEGIMIMALIGTFVMSTAIFGFVSWFAGFMMDHDDWSLASWLWSCVIFGIIAVIYVGSTAFLGG